MVPTDNTWSPAPAAPVTLAKMIVELMKEYRFEAAHRLPRVPEGHKCARVHGHSYRVELFIAGEVNPETGWLIDFAAIDDAWAPLYAKLDHRNLNDVSGLENSTCENLVAFIWAAVKARVPQLSAVTLWETADSKCTYRGS
jgi:6-pyruvoyltetrahydropterin/6-carboxytetrahydropterin synthase